MKRILILLLVITATFGCTNQNKNDNAKGTMHKVDVTIDWVPSPEYYGFIYARENGFYRKAGLDVTIHYGTGAPVVANEVATGAIYAGTTTSDNVLRQIGRGATFSRVIPILPYNPSVIASMPEKNIKTLSDLKGKTLGTNKQASVYQQLLYLIATGKVEQNSFKEYPIGYGGAKQLESGEVDAILAYTTNAVLDVKKDKKEVAERLLSDDGIETFGLVLIIGSDKDLSRAEISNNDLHKFIEVTKKAYEDGASDKDGVISALKKADPTLDENKIKLAIDRITYLKNAGFAKLKDKNYLQKLDTWVDGPEITADVRKKCASLIGKEI